MHVYVPCYKAFESRLEDGVADGIRTRNNKLHKLGLYH